MSIGVMNFFFKLANGYVLATIIYQSQYCQKPKSILDLDFGFGIGPLPYNDNHTTFIKFALVVYIYLKKVDLSIITISK